MLVTAGLTASPAMADPAKSDVFELDCGTAGSFMAVSSPGNGGFTPAFDTASNRVFVPVSLGETFMEIYYESGEPIYVGPWEPAIPRAGKRTGQGTMACTFSIDFEEVDPEYGPIYGTYSGSVIVKTKSA